MRYNHTDYTNLGMHLIVKQNRVQLSIKKLQDLTYFTMVLLELELEFFLGSAEYFCYFLVLLS